MPGNAGAMAKRLSGRRYRIGTDGNDAHPEIFRDQGWKPRLSRGLAAQPYSALRSQRLRPSLIAPPAHNLARKCSPLRSLRKACTLVCASLSTVESGISERIRCNQGVVRYQSFSPDAAIAAARFFNSFIGTSLMWVATCQTCPKGSSKEPLRSP